MAVGIIVGVIILFNINWDDFSMAKEVYEELPTNEFAKAEYVASVQIVMMQVSIALGSILSSIISGVFFHGFAEMLQTLKAINKKTPTSQHNINGEQLQIK